MKNRKSLRDLILAAVLCALVVVMTVVPYTGYITVGGTLEITTLHIVTILAGVLLGWKYGAVVGAVWGLTCILRCLLAMPWFQPYGFANVFVALFPRVLVGAVSGLVFAALKKDPPDQKSFHRHCCRSRFSDQHGTGAFRHDDLLPYSWCGRV